MPNKTAIAIGAHPDDIEFKMAGTLLLLKQAGWEIHYLNVANGCCGSTQYARPRLKRMRAAEARRAAKILGARFHPSLANDMEIVYSLQLVRRIAAIIREVKPGVILTHPPIDYMEDHTNTCRLVASAAFTRAMPNFKTSPARKPYAGEATLYHATPHGLCDTLRRPLHPDLFVDTSSVRETMLAAQLEHRSQFAWLKTTQSMESATETMDAASLAVGRLSKRFKHAEGWWRHLHYGYCATNADPLRETLGPLTLLRKPSHR